MEIKLLISYDISNYHNDFKKLILDFFEETGVC